MSDDSNELICILFLIAIICIFWYAFLIALGGIGLFYYFRNRSRRKHIERIAAINLPKINKTKKKYLKCEECGCADNRLEMKFCNFCGSDNLCVIQIYT